MTAPKKKPQIPVGPQLSAQDCHNIVQLLNRVQTNGIQEAQVLLSVAQKLAQMRQHLDPNFGAENGEDVSSTD